MQVASNNGAAQESHNKAAIFNCAAVARTETVWVCFRCAGMADSSKSRVSGGAPLAGISSTRAARVPRTSLASIQTNNISFCKYQQSNKAINANSLNYLPLEAQLREVLQR